MEADGQPSRALTNDVRAVDWLPLDAALERLSRTHERAFIAQVGPLAIEAARQPRVRRPAAAKRRGRQLDAAATRSIGAPDSMAAVPAAARPQPTSAPPQPLFEQCAVTAAEASIAPAAFEPGSGLAEAAVKAPQRAEEGHPDAAGSHPDRSAKLIQKLRVWLRGAA
jgi:8-oxo-dGTP diphosphatase